MRRKRADEWSRSLSVRAAACRHGAAAAAAAATEEAIWPRGLRLDLERSNLHAQVLFDRVVARRLGLGLGRLARARHLT